MFERLNAGRQSRKLCGNLCFTVLRRGLILLSHGHYFTFIEVDIGIGIYQLILFALMENAITPLRILIIDDDALSRDVLALLLEHAGYVVGVADSGDAALRYLASIPELLPQVVLTDIQMPGISGGVLARALREHCEAATLLLAMSGSIPKTEITREFDGLLLKPFNIADLDAAISAKGTHFKSPDQPIPHEKDPLDENIYGKLAASMRRERLGQLYALSLKDVENRVSRMQDFASNKEDVAFRREAHAIRGGAGMVGAVELQMLATSMEENGIPANHVASLGELIVACKRLRRILMERKNI